MLLDNYALFSDAQAITATAVSTNHMNLGPTGSAPGSSATIPRDLGGGGNVPLLIQVVEGFAGLTSLTVSVEMADNSSFSSAKTVGSTGAIALADLVAGKVLPLNAFPIGSDDQYVRLRYTVAGSDATAGKITAGVTAGIQTNG